jgi:hypothetical protein
MVAGIALCRGVIYRNVICFIGSFFGGIIGGGVGFKNSGGISSSLTLSPTEHQSSNGSFLSTPTTLSAPAP